MAKARVLLCEIKGHRPTLKAIREAIAQLHPNAKIKFDKRRNGIYLSGPKFWENYPIRTHAR